MAQRTCTIAGCGKAHRAKGLCVTHYNRLKMTANQRHPKAAATCVICDTTVLRRPSGHRAPTCSVGCRAVVQWGTRLAPTEGYNWRQMAADRARRHGVPVVTPFDREQVFARDDWTCQLCGIRCSSPNPYELTAATVDHIKPLSAGGAHVIGNAQTACLSCNSRKQGDLISPAA